ncbi:SIR2 family protein [Imperialibacter roseus]|uniref:SIR2 family protein n=1 Tax=Imperialibacter roseus TaxID=1324217 RepID=A0ABZ0II82_9BACT|nr:SIR2 family protein [Imperialibacter roseus]WOK04740.1 SIR2 family protein [Imperialibacter roseus]
MTKMAGHDFESITEELRKQLDSSRQNWLLGAGVSYKSNIPLMYPLTDRIKNLIVASKVDKDIEIYNSLTVELQDKSHIEHYLSHIGDLIALADRSKTQSATVGGKSVTKNELLNLHRSIISAIGETVRYGYSNEGSEVVGSFTKPIVEIEHHIKFVQALYSNRSNLLSRSKLTFFSTNYDTLLEDALGLEKFTVVDGFSGGAIAYWNPQFEFQDNHSLPNKCLLYKLHGSIDWHRDEKKGLVRTRYGTKYLANKSEIMIYPQATKYVETQKDPFSYLFNGFRNALNSNDDNVLITCGYSFGDDHINAEIEAALSSRDNRTTIIAFAQESPDGSIKINKTLDTWLTDKQFGNRIYVAGQKGVYYNSTSPLQPADKKDLVWWTFSGLTNFILTGDHD